MSKKNQGALARLLPVALTALLLLAAPASASAASYVIDEAGIVPPDVEARINELGTRLEEKSGGAQVVVVTVQTLGGAEIEEYAEQRFGELGVGDREKNRGVALFVAMSEKKMRIEVGYGLEGAIPDAKAGSIIDEAIRPRFSAGDMPGGIEAGYRAIAAEVAEEAGIEVEGAEAADDTPWLPILIFAGIVLTILIVSAVRRKSGGGPWIGGSFVGGSGSSSSGSSWSDSSSGGSSFGGGGFSGGGGDSGGGGASGGW